MNMAAGGNRYLGDSPEVLNVWGDDDVDILGAPYDAPGIDRQTANDDKFDICFGEAPEQLIEGWFAQLWRAAPVNCISLWLRAIPSARFTLRDRCASSRSRRVRTISAAWAGEWLILTRCFMA
jgi:hypothetical protein